jgi:hypothetical protein
MSLYMYTTSIFYSAIYENKLFRICVPEDDRAGGGGDDGELGVLPEDDRDGCGGDDGELGDDGGDEGGGRHVVHQVQQAQAFLRPPVF